MSLVKDLDFGLRLLARSPGFTAAAVLSLALGIGANTAIFSLVNAIFLRPLPVEDPGSLVAIFNRTESGNVSGLQADFFPVSFPNFRDFREQNSAFSDLAAFCWMRTNLSSGAEAEQLWGEIVTANYFELLGVEALHGRTILPDEDEPGKHPVVVLGHALWSRRFGSDPGLIGKTLRINGHDLTVIGVTPPGFKGVNQIYPKDLWVPMAMYQQVFPLAPYVETRNFGLFGVVGRLRPGVSLEKAQVEMARIAANLERDFPDDNQGKGINLVTLAQASVDPNQKEALERGGLILMLAVLLVLAIACINVANLLLARALLRFREVAIRLSIGAGRGRLLRQFLTESALLAVGGGALGLLLGSWLVKLLWHFRPPYLPVYGLDLSLDGRVLAFVSLLAAAAMVGIGIVPALQTFKVDLLSALKTEGRIPTGSQRLFSLRNVLVIGQVALSLVALTAAGLFVRSLRNFHAIEPGFETRNLALISFDLEAQEYEEPAGRQFQQRLLQKMASIPGVQAATLGAHFPLTPAGVLSKLEIEGAQDLGQGEILVRTDSVEPGYFEVLGVPLRQGRGFRESDGPGGLPVAVINETMASRFWPGQEAVGRRFRLSGGPLHEVIGIVRDAKYVSLAEPPQPFVYLSARQSYSPAMTLFVRTGDDPERLIPTLRREIQTLDHNLPLANIMTGFSGPTAMDAVVAGSLWGQRLLTLLLLCFGMLALVLAMLGVYGVMTYSVSQRHLELGIRMALGAQRQQVLRLVLRQGMLIVAVGVAVGLLAALFAGRLAGSLLYGLSAADSLTLAGVTLVLALVAVVANLLSARRAARVDPSVVLRAS